MKPTRQNRFCIKQLLAVTYFFAMSAGAHAASQTWKTSTFTDGNWNDATNWVGGAVPGAASGSANIDVATFNGGTNLAVTIDSGRNIGSILFDTASAGAFTFSGGPLTITNAGNITINSVVTNSQTFNNDFLGSPNATATAYSFLNNSATSGAKLNIAGNITGQMTATTETFTFGGSNGGTVSGIISNGVGGGNVALTKSGAGTWTLTGANGYTGTTTISAGTLALSGGNNRLATTGTVNFSAASTLDIGSTTQSLANLTFTANTSFTGNVNGSGGKLTLTGSSFTLGSGGSGSTQTLNLSGLTEFNYNNAAGIFRVTGTNNSGNGSAGVLTLGGTNTITASTFVLGDTAATVLNNGSPDVGTVNLGVTNTLNADTITIGSGSRSAGNVLSQAGTTSLTLRGSDTTSRVNAMLVGNSSGPNFASGQQGTVNLTNAGAAANLDAMITTLTIGRNDRGGNAGNPINNTGTFTMGAGTLDALTINLGQVLVGFTNAGTTSSTTGNLTIGTGGTIKVNNFYFADQQASAASSVLNANFNLNGGANLYAANIAKGTGAGTGGTTRTFNWNDGTIHNYNTSTDLTFGNGITVNLASTGTHTFDIGTSRTGTVDSVLAGAGGTLAKAGAGTLILNGINNYTGATTINAGKLLVNGTHISATASGYSVTGTNSTLGGTGRIAINANVSVASGAILAPGASIGTLTLDGVNTVGNVLTMSAGADFAVELAGNGSSADQLAFWNYTGGDLVLNNNEINLDLLGALSPGTYNVDIFKFFSNAGTTATTHSFLNGLTIGTLNPNISSATIDWDGTGNNNQAIGLNFTVVPEPGAALLGSLGLLALLRRRRN